jgi:predicted GIY-YIG superfamily endonuclease
MSPIDKWYLRPRVWHRGWAHGPCVAVNIGWRPSVNYDRNIELPELSQFPQEVQDLAATVTKHLRHGFGWDKPRLFTGGNDHRSWYDGLLRCQEGFRAVSDLCDLQGVPLDKEMSEYWSHADKDILNIVNAVHEEALTVNKKILPLPAMAAPLSILDFIDSKCSNAGVVYAIQCATSHQVYIGETQNESQRRKEHFSGAFSTSRVLTQGPYKQFLKWVVLHRENDYSTRLRLERVQREIYAQADWVVINNEDIRIRSRRCTQ